MRPRLPVSVLLAVRNEEKNIRKCLASLSPAKEIVVLDSMSGDDTAKISLEEFAATVIQFRYSGGYPKKRQWALMKCSTLRQAFVVVDRVQSSLWITQKNHLLSAS